MLQDPEQPASEWTLPVTAPNLATARERCELIARRSPLIDVINVTQSGKKPNKKGEYSYICWFRSEANPDDSRNG
jgi:hypothetical protein